MSQFEIESLWVENRLDVAFSFGDIVRVKSGENVAKEGRIVALFVLEPLPTYMIELYDGSSVAVVEPDVELVKGNTGDKLLLFKE
ncbi:MAG TPA: hypothetical protein VN844_04105 [Pyrinomonadaceae bacterium]|nr:hypothetical protein [Pyrinomonadaceae bacterium]